MRHQLDGECGPGATASGIRQLAARFTNWMRDPRLKYLEADDRSASIRERLNPMWLSYVVLTGWALYYVVAVSETTPSALEATSPVAMVSNAAVLSASDAHSDIPAASVVGWFPASAVCPAAPRRDGPIASSACSGESHCPCASGHESAALVDVPALLEWAVAGVSDRAM